MIASSVARCLLPVLVLISGYGEADDQRYAVTTARIDGPKGTIRLTQIIAADERNTKITCERFLEAARDARRRTTIESQHCMMELPPEVSGVLSGSPVPGAYAVGYDDRGLLSSGTRVYDLYYYSFDAGTPSEVCEWALGHYRQRDPKATCTPPTQ
jgi:hypothetical protein